jgi:hypothetical protein
MPTTETIEAGFDRIDGGYNDTNGYYQGTDPLNAPAAGNQDGSGMFRLVGAQTVPLAPTEAEVITVSGDDEPLTQFSFDSPDLPSGVLQTATENLTLEANAQGTKVEVLGDLTIGVRQPTGSTPASLCMAFQRQAKDWTIGALGVSKRSGLWVPRIELRPRGPADLTQRQHSPSQWNLITSKSDRKPWGATFTATENGTTSAALIPIKSSYILQLHRWTGDNSQTDFFLPYVAVGTPTTLFVFINGELQTVTTHYTVTPGTPSGKTTIAFGSPPGTDAIINSLYGVAAANI